MQGIRFLPGLTPPTTNAFIVATLNKIVPFVGETSATLAVTEIFVNPDTEVKTA